MRVVSLAACILISTSVLTSVSGCGYQPVYGRSGAVKAAVARVQVAPLPDRQGQVLRNLLIDRMNPEGQPGNAPYVLRIEYSENLSQLAIRRDETATRANLHVSVSFELVEVASGVPVLRGRSRRISSYNLLQSDYANLIARRTAQRRASALLADDVALRVALFFNRTQRLRGRKGARPAPKPTAKPAQ